MQPKDELAKHINEAPPIVLSVLQSFKVTRSFVAGIDDYRVEGQPKAFTDDWYGFMDTYAILMWGSRDICTNANFQILKLIDVLKFATQDEPNLPVIKAKLEAYLNTPDTTADKSRELTNNLKNLDSSINGWKQTVFQWIDSYVPKKDDGTSRYRMLMKALSDLKEHLPPTDRTDMKTAWLSDTMIPVTVSTGKIQGTWQEVWFEAQSVVNEISYAKDAATIKGMKMILEQALSAYQILGKALGDYADVLGKDDLYWAYQNAIHRKH